jgi:transcriptional antiterminator
MTEKYYITSNELAELVGCSIRSARQVIKAVNKDLTKRGVIVLSQRTTLRSEVFERLGLSQKGTLNEHSN